MARFQTVDDYIASFPEDVRTTLEAVRSEIRRAVPGTTEGISYGIPAFGQDGRFIVWFAGWKRHISVYPIPTGDPALGSRSGALRGSKGHAPLPARPADPARADRADRGGAPARAGGRGALTGSPGVGITQDARRCGVVLDGGGRRPRSAGGTIPTMMRPPWVGRG